MAVPAQNPTCDDRHYLECELEELVKDNKVWQFIREGSLDGIWYWDLENPQNEWMSPELWELLGIDPATKAHDPAEWQDLIHPEDLVVATENFNAHCADPDHPYDQIVRYRHADGSTIWVRCRGLAIRDATGKPVRMLGAHNDVTALKQAEEAANRAHGVATHANEELQAFAYSTSHDLKSPANTIRMLLQEARLALQGGAPKDAHSLLTKAEATNEAMRNMVDKLLEYTRVAGSEIVLEPVDLDRLITEVIDGLGADIMATGARVDIGPLGWAMGSDWQLRQIFQNLISNAIKFQVVGNEPQVTISAQPAPKNRVKIEVGDNGIGIPVADQKRVFELFSKLHHASKFQGSGVGLAFCARAAKAHGSDMSIRSTEDGTVFSVDLALCEVT
ncbi:MAG: PAS domain-containing sensor histidine kinase [Pseudomonadota bacterium]